eukprot:COSAG02_NODE_74_length_41878_cov_9.737954_24_plen_67_part_00
MMTVLLSRIQSTHAAADVTVVSTDYAKAYDTVQHEPLFAVAYAIGGSGYESWLRTLYTGHERIGCA